MEDKQQHIFGTTHAKIHLFSLNSWLGRVFKTQRLFAGQTILDLSW